MSWGRLSLIGLVVLAGCASQSSTNASAPAADSSTGSAARGRLTVSSASNHSVQPQPPANSCHARGSGLYWLPDPHCTPGAISPAVRQAGIDSTICSSGYTRGVRPSERISEAEKRESMAAYGDSGPAGDYEYDHLVPLELGGATNDPRNLWPEPGRTPNPKDELERRLNRLVCEHRLSLAQAQLEIAGNWVAAARAHP